MARLLERIKGAITWPRLALAGVVAAGIAIGGGLAWDRQRQRLDLAKALTGGDPKHAPALITRYGCAGCHMIGGVPGADGKVGPDLRGLFQRVFIGGVARNTAGNLVAWIVDPQSFDPKVAMPRTGIGEAEARDVAAYLYAH